MFDDISFLVQETLKDAASLRQSDGPLLDCFHSEEERLPEEVPGILYHLQKKASTFVVRIHPCENLKTDYQKVLENPHSYTDLRLNESEKKTKEVIKYFECDRFELAKTIKKTLGNKRYPLFEERVFNISDPGDSWWIKIEGNRMGLLFKLSHTEDLSKLVKIGPLGDPQKAMETLNQLYGYFKMIFPVGDYACGHGQWSVSCLDENDANFHYLKSLFLNGETSHDFWEYLRQLESQSQGAPYLESLQKANYFLMELSCIREFWKQLF